MVSVRGKFGEYVGIVVRVIVREGNFGVIIDVIHRDGSTLRARSKVVHLRFHLFPRKLLRPFGRHFLECGVISVVARIEHGDQHPLALVFDLG